MVLERQYGFSALELIVVGCKFLKILLSELRVVTARAPGDSQPVLPKTSRSSGLVNYSHTQEYE